MSLIIINRKVYKALDNNEEAKRLYVKDIVYNVFEDYFENEEIKKSDYKNIVNGVISLIESNEKIIQKYSWKEYLERSYPAKDECLGVHYSSGKYGVMAFDWSAEILDDLDYSFNVFKVL
jgi:hypothetical protein